MRKLRNGLLAIALMLGSITFLQAQEKKKLSLGEAIELGLENSKQLKIALSKSKEAGYATREMKESMLPDLDASGQYMRFNEPTVDINPDLIGESSESEGSSPVPKYLSMGSVTAELPLFAGFKIRNGIQSSQYLEKAAQLDAEAQKSDVILNLVNAYINLYKAQEAVKLVKENLQESHQRVVDFSRLEKNGVLALNDLLKAQLQESNTSLALLDAQNNQRVANYNMDLMLGLDDQTQLMLDSVNADQLPELLTANDLREKAMVERKDLQAIVQREKASETAVKIAKGNYWPSIGLSGGYIAADIDQIATITNAWNVAIGVSFSLSELYKNGSHVHQAKERHLQTQLMHNQLTDRVKSEVFQSFSDYLESIQRMDVYVVAEQQANENYRITKNKHENSLATTTDLLDADVDKFQAELNLRFSKADALLAYCKLLEVSGQLDSESVATLTTK